jgi:acyl-CoA synthetase (AMP-forming)/AMP-acid ligase II
MNIASVLANTARSQGNETAVFHGVRPVWTYREVARRASTLAQGLQHRLGVARGDRILLWAGNSPEYIEVMFAAWFAGAVIVPVNIALHPREVASIANDCGAKLCFTSLEKISALQAFVTSHQGPNILPIEEATLNELRGEDLGLVDVPSARERRGLCRGTKRDPGDRFRAGRTVPFANCALQAPEGIPLFILAAEEQRRQGTKARTAG